MIRQFWLTNEKGEEFDLRPGSSAMLSNPKGMAEGAGVRSYWQGNRTFVQTDYKDSQSTITGTVNFRHANYFTEFEKYIHSASELYLHVVRNNVPERYCEVDCAITDRPEDFAGWILATVSFRRLSVWRSCPKQQTFSITNGVNYKFLNPGSGSLPTAFEITFKTPSLFAGTIRVTDGNKQLKTVNVTVSAGNTIKITCIEGKQNILIGSIDGYGRIDFSNSSFFEISPGSDLEIVFSSSVTGSGTLVIYDQWNEA